jgi:hypothetical protein
VSAVRDQLPGTQSLEGGYLAAACVATKMASAPSHQSRASVSCRGWCLSFARVRYTYLV